MKTVRSIKSMHDAVRELKSAGKAIAFVPTMGALHEGHLSLVRRARESADITVASIYVNPTQFARGEDLSKYPRSLERDKELLVAEGVDFLFLPDNNTMYPNGLRSYVDCGELGSILEGEFRPTHFRGVATIVTKLFHIVCPDIAIFGQKDAQQSFVVRRLIEDLDFKIKLVVSPTIREKSGLAMSSRNRYFDTEQLGRASCIYRGLRVGREFASSGKVTISKIVEIVRREIERTPGTTIEYIAVRRAEDFREVFRLTDDFLILSAVRLDGVRLIDNIRVNVG